MIQIIKYKIARDFLKQFHYLDKNNSKTRSGKNYGLYLNNELIGVCIYYTMSNQGTAKCMLKNPDHVVYEMGRLCLRPDIKIKNILSKFVSLTFKHIRMNFKEIDYILTYADSSQHSGKIYQALSLGYYGMTKKEQTYYFILQNGTEKKRGREKIKGTNGYYKPRTKKHRYVKCLKKGLKKNIKWIQKPYSDITTKNTIFNKY